MKKYLRSLMFDALLALVLLWGLVSPQSAAMNFVAAWALFGSFVCITASLALRRASPGWCALRRASPGWLLMSTGCEIPAKAFPSIQT
ncbi:hypothetical protein LTSEJOH_4644 [Salmonella enterica subsp. enterica serovar Johannesburg str. S5-703]|nr:hypothetical protein LTSEJOH_4644 [Salmonella enterica subsp. enterica serovar Johannesburg str. S5-703]